MTKPDHTHPLVATTAELSGQHRKLPSVHGECVPNGQCDTFVSNSIASISEALFSDDEKPMPKERLDWLVSEYTDFMSRAPAKSRFLFTLATGLVSISAPLLIAKLPPFTRLSFSERIRALRKLERRALGKILIPLRAILCLIYYEHPDAAADLQLHHQPKKLVQVSKR